MDTLQRGIPDVLSRHGGCIKSDSTGELAHQLALEILPALVLLPTMDKHLVLKLWHMSKHDIHLTP